jgi:hypothetical protein
MTTSARAGTALIVYPGPATACIFDLILLMATGVGLEVLRTDRNDAVLREPSARRLYLTQYPSLSMIEAIDVGELAAVVVMDDPFYSVIHARQSGTSTLLEAVRPMTASMTANLAVGRTSRSRIVFPVYNQPLLVTARTLASALGLALDLATLQSIVASVSKGAEQDRSFAAIVGVNMPVMEQTLSAADREIIAQVVGGLIEMAQGKLASPVIWPASIFLSGDRPNEPAPRIASVVGPTRVVVYGPYLHLPPARYAVSLIVAFSPGIDDMAFLLEFYAASTCLARLRIDGRRSGGYRGTFALNIADPVAPIEIRLSNERGAIEGEISLVELRFIAQVD